MAATGKAVRPSAGERALLSISDLVLIRIAAGGATRAELQRDLTALLAPKISGTQFRRAAELSIGQLAGQNLISESKGKLTATAAGERSAESILGGGRVAHGTWIEIRNIHFVGLALGLNPEIAAIAKALERLDGLAALILQTHYSIPLTRVLSATDLRAALAVIALEKAFGNKIKTGLGKGSGLPGKTARVLAAQLLKKPREIAGDGKLVMTLAAEVAGAHGETLEALRLAVLRRLVNIPLPARGKNAGAAGDDDAPPVEMPDAANDVAPLEAPPPKMAPPDMSEFVSSVLEAARPVSEGWPGNKKAFISRVWQAIRAARREWELTEIAFKSMLAEAHRCGQLVLATADLKDKSSLKDLEESKILYKNTVWHFVRVED